MNSIYNEDFSRAIGTFTGWFEEDRELSGHFEFTPLCPDEVYHVLADLSISLWFDIHDIFHSSWICIMALIDFMEKTKEAYIVMSPVRVTLIAANGFVSTMVVRDDMKKKQAILDCILNYINYEYETENQPSGELR